MQIHARTLIRFEQYLTEEEKAGLPSKNTGEISAASSIF